MTGLTDLAISGPLLLATLLALTAGAVSFASPCCLPLVPGYLAYLAGLAGTPDIAPISRTGDIPTGASTRAAVARPTRRPRLLAASMLFVSGFTVVFTAGIMSVLGLSDLLYLNGALLQRIGGVVTVAMGLVFLGLFLPLQREMRIHRRPGHGLWGAPVLGAVFGLGWTPCLGPTLTGVLALAAGTQVGLATPRGLLLVLAYSLGLGLPFVAARSGSRVGGARDWLGTPPCPRCSDSRRRNAGSGRVVAGERIVGIVYRLVASPHRGLFDLAVGVLMARPKTARFVDAGGARFRRDHRGRYDGACWATATVTARPGSE